MTYLPTSVFAAGLLFLFQTLPALGNEAAIGQIITRRYEVTITTGSDGVRYIVKAPGGTELAASLSSEELKTQYPNIYRQLEPAVASQLQAPEAFIWAGS